MISKFVVSNILPPNARHASEQVFILLPLHAKPNPSNNQIHSMHETNAPYPR